MSEERNAKPGKIIKGFIAGVGGLLTISCIGYVIKEVKREYDDTVDENNRLRSFINEHDFYEKKQSNLRSTDYVKSSSNDLKPDENDFNRNQPVYKQSASAMRKLGLNPDGTNKTKTQLVKIGEYISENGYVVEVKEDIPTGLRIFSPTNRTVLS